MRRRGSSASSGHCPMSAGHHACASCSASRTTSAPSASQAVPTNMTRRWGRRTSASQRSRSGSTLHSSRSSRASVSAGDSPRSTAPPAPSAQRPGHELSHGARRPASQRPPASRVTHSAATRVARVALDQPQRPARGLQLEDQPAVSRSWCETSRAATPSWLGEPRSRSALIASSAATHFSSGGS